MHQGVLQLLTHPAPSSLAQRLRARLAAVPLPRLRRILLGLYIAMALADTAGKTLAAHPAVSDAVLRRLRGEAAAEMQDARRPSGNFEIFRASSRHLLAGQDLYAQYPTEQDRYKYSPTFALLFAPLALIPWPVALFLWSVINAGALFAAVERVLPGRQGMVALGFLYLEVLRIMQNAQSNTVVTALIIFAWLALEKGRGWRAAGAVAVGACIKIFPIAALTFALPWRRGIRTGLQTAVTGIGLALLPLLVTSPATLMAQYRSWFAIEESEAVERWFSVMQLLHHWTGAAFPNWPVQLAGVVLLTLPLLLRRDRWPEPRFRLLYLCSVLLFIPLFNHQGERASYLIGFTGATIWFASSPPARWRRALYGVAFVTITLMSTLIPGAVFKLPVVVLYRLALPTLLIWLAVQWALWREPERREL